MTQLRVGAYVITIIYNYYLILLEVRHKTHKHVEFLLLRAVPIRPNNNSLQEKINRLGEKENFYIFITSKNELIYRNMLKYLKHNL